MAEQTNESDRTERTGRGPSIVGVLWALVFGVVAVVGFTGNFQWLADSATKWIIAGVVALVGLAMVLTALPGRSGD
ncbi:hypothetical protein [Nakamurella lactea]|uniref:hypothetical protein n=1 Tax=Nakamurella lactea TaxID=459515 RepID=UPI000409C4DD|nr:hypothetical protein [Nakamurella lactea]